MLNYENKEIQNLYFSKDSFLGFLVDNIKILQDNFNINYENNKLNKYNLLDNLRIKEENYSNLLQKKLSSYNTDPNNISKIFSNIIDATYLFVHKTIDLNKELNNTINHIIELTNNSKELSNKIIDSLKSDFIQYEKEADIFNNLMNKKLLNNKIINFDNIDNKNMSSKLHYNYAHNKFKSLKDSLIYSNLNNLYKNNDVLYCELYQKISSLKIKINQYNFIDFKNALSKMNLNLNKFKYLKKETCNSFSLTDNNIFNKIANYKKNNYNKFSRNCFTNSKTINNNYINNTVSTNIDSSNVCATITTHDRNTTNLNNIMHKSLNSYNTLSNRYNFNNKTLNCQNNYVNYNATKFVRLSNNKNIAKEKERSLSIRINTQLSKKKDNYKSLINPLIIKKESILNTNFSNKNKNQKLPSYYLDKIHRINTKLNLNINNDKTNNCYNINNEEHCEESKGLNGMKTTKYYNGLNKFCASKIKKNNYINTFDSIDLDIVSFSLTYNCIKIYCTNKTHNNFIKSIENLKNTIVHISNENIVLKQKSKEYLLKEIIISNVDSLCLASKKNINSINRFLNVSKAENIIFNGKCKFNYKKVENIECITYKGFKDKTIINKLNNYNLIETDLKNLTKEYNSLKNSFKEAQIKVNKLLSIQKDFAIKTTVSFSMFNKIYRSKFNEKLCITSNNSIQVNNFSNKINKQLKKCQNYNFFIDSINYNLINLQIYLNESFSLLSNNHNSLLSCLTYNNITNIIDFNKLNCLIYNTKDIINSKLFILKDLYSRLNSFNYFKSRNNYSNSLKNYLTKQELLLNSIESCFITGKLFGNKDNNINLKMIFCKFESFAKLLFDVLKVNSEFTNDEINLLLNLNSEIECKIYKKNLIVDNNISSQYSNNFNNNFNNKKYINKSDEVQYKSFSINELKVQNISDNNILLFNDEFFKSMSYKLMSSIKIINFLLNSIMNISEESLDINCLNIMDYEKINEFYNICIYLNQKCSSLQFKQINCNNNKTLSECYQYLDKIKYNYIKENSNYFIINDLILKSIIHYKSTLEQTNKNILILKSNISDLRISANQSIIYNNNTNNINQNSLFLDEELNNILLCKEEVKKHSPFDNDIMEFNNYKDNNNKSICNKNNNSIENNIFKKLNSNNQYYTTSYNNNGNANKFTSTTNELNTNYNLKILEVDIDKNITPYNKDTTAKNVNNDETNPTERLFNNQLQTIKAELRDTRCERDLFKKKYEKSITLASDNKGELIMLLGSSIENLIKEISLNNKVKQLLSIVLKILNYSQNEIDTLLKNKNKSNINTINVNSNRIPSNNILSTVSNNDSNSLYKEVNVKRQRLSGVGSLMKIFKKDN